MRKVGRVVFLKKRTIEDGNTSKEKEGNKTEY